MTVDEELVREIRAALSAAPSVRELGDGEAVDVAEEVRRRFIADPDKVWWWDALAVKSVTLPYGDGDGVEMIHRLVRGDEVIHLVATDDEMRPWPCWEGQAREIMDALREIRFFEYFISSRDHRWVIFDTHHDSLVAAGDVLEDARLIKANQDDQAQP